MPTLVIETFINAAPETCFDLIRDKRVISETAGPIGDAGLGKMVTFESKNFGMRQKLTVKIVEFERPRRLVDEMTDGTFKAFKHIHEFIPKNGGTLMRDTLVWTSPFGILGQIVDEILLERYLQNLVTTRNAKLKAVAEAAF